MGGHCGRSAKAARDCHRDGTDSYDEVIFGRKRPDSVVVDWAKKVLFVLEFKPGHPKGEKRSIRS